MSFNMAYLVNMPKDVLNDIHRCLDHVLTFRQGPFRETDVTIYCADCDQAILHITETMPTVYQSGVHMQFIDVYHAVAGWKAVHRVFVDHETTGYHWDVQQTSPYAYATPLEAYSYASQWALDEDIPLRYYDEEVLEDLKGGD